MVCLTIAFAAGCGESPTDRMKMLTQGHWPEEGQRLSAVRHGHDRRFPAAAQCDHPCDVE